MARLVHLNGPPGIGKSTLARRYVDDRPLALCLDIDVIRSLLGRWDEDEQASGSVARRLAVGIATGHLAEGYDVVVPQYVARPQFVHQMRSAAVEAGAAFHEVVLMADAIVASARFDARADDPERRDHHRDAVRMMAGVGGFASMYERLLAVLPALPSAVVLDAADGLEQCYEQLLRHLDASGAGGRR